MIKRSQMSKNELIQLLEIESCYILSLMPLKCFIVEIGILLLTQKQNLTKGLGDWMGI